jgi:guanine nucleotide-binding protein G(I)/G(S)/G(T) subunit beta-1
MDDEEEDLCEEEIELLKEINNLKDQLDILRRQVQDTDFFTMTESISELGRIKFKPSRSLKGHHAYVNDLHWNEDGEHLVTVSKDAYMIVWNTLTRSKEHIFHLGSQWINKCGCSPSGCFAACGGIDEICSIYGMRTEMSEESISQSRQKLHGHSNYISGCRFLDDDRIMTSSGDKTCRLWDIDEGKETECFNGHTEDVTGFEFQSKSAQCFVSVSSDRSCRVWDVRTQACSQIFEGHTEPVTGLTFFPESSYAFFTSSEDHTCRQWDLRGDQPVALYGDEYVESSVNCVAVSRSGRLLIAGYDDHNLHVWDVLREERVGIMPAHEGRVASVGVPKTGYCAASCANDNIVYLWVAK